MDGELLFLCVSPSLCEVASQIKKKTTTKPLKKDDQLLEDTTSVLVSVSAMGTVWWLCLTESP